MEKHTHKHGFKMITGGEFPRRKLPMIQEILDNHVLLEGIL